MQKTEFYQIIHTKFSTLITLLILTHKVGKIFRHRSLRAHEQKIFYDTLPLMFRAEQSNYVCSVLSSTEAEQMQNRRVTV